jgi:hypothetical protein
VSQRRRFLDGFYLPIAIFAVGGLYSLLLHVSTYARRLVLFAYIAIGSLLPLFVISATMIHPPAAAFLSNDEYQIFPILAAQPAGLVLSDSSIGGVIPAYTADSVYVGNYTYTFNYAAKTKDVCSLFRSGDDTALAAFVATQHVRYFVWTAGCSPNFTFDASQFPSSWRLIYAAPGVRVYRVF